MLPGTGQPHTRVDIYLHVCKTTSPYPTPRTDPEASGFFGHVPQNFGNVGTTIPKILGLPSPTPDWSDLLQ
uniref:Uncharacterized protein n=1 Tax=Romanomermis culicivorax TaxID=13658 RepID=A0A915JVZ5_ROMCU